MNVSQQNIDNVNAVITIDIVKADYQEKVDKALRTYRQKANVPGFRPGMVPMGMVRKMFGKSVQLEEINKTVSESLFGYIRDNKLNILGEPLPSLDQPEIDFENQEDFTVKFDIALAPQIELNLSQEDVVDFYDITIDEEMVEKQIESFRSSYAVSAPVEEAGEKDMLRGAMAELDEAGNVVEGGIAVESTILSPVHFKNDEEKAHFAAAKVGDKVVFNPSVACDGHEAELASMLHIEKEAVAAVKGNFQFEVTEITSLVPAELNQELFDKVYGEGTVTTEEEFRAKVAATLAEQLTPESDYKFGMDARTVIENKLGDIELPEAFLKRWLVASGENRTEESVEAEFPQMLPDLKWHLIKENLVKTYEIKTEEADVLDMAKRVTRAQFAQYGMATVPDEILNNYAAEMLKNKESVRSIAERATEEKIILTIKEHVALNKIAINIEEFYKLFETNNQEA